MKSNKYSKLLVGMKEWRTNNPQVMQLQYQYQNSFKQTYLCELTVWNGHLFQKHYPNLNIQFIIQDFKQPIQLPSQVLGKRSSEILISRSRNYCFKIIEADDLKKLQIILSEYLQFKQKSQMDFLIEIYFVFAVKTLGKNCDFFILMPNIRGSLDKSIRVFDLKGHINNRELCVNDFQDFRFGKDGNFIDSIELKWLRDMPKEKLLNFYSILQYNVEFLRARGILDYSILLSFEKNQGKEAIKTKENPGYNIMQLTKGIVLKWAIIDYFQEYTDKKKLENKFKSILYKQVSSVDPDFYAKRFLNFIGSLLGIVQNKDKY